MKKKSLNCLEIGDYFKFSPDSDLCIVKAFTSSDGIRICHYEYVNTKLFSVDSKTLVFPG